MGDEIHSDHFSAEDFIRYRERLTSETEQLQQWFHDEAFSKREGIAGLELEAWIVDADCRPAPENEKCIAAMDSKDVVPELAKFNLELNVTPQRFAEHGLSGLEKELIRRWQDCNRIIEKHRLSLMMTGILPTLDHHDLTIANMSPLNRYKALNEQVFTARQGRPIVLDITGREHMRLVHHDVMLESAATSFQLHLQVPQNLAKRYLNAGILLSAPMVATGANSPYLFGRDLWDETRIPLFEQSVDVGGYAGAARGPVKRVTFGGGYVQQSLCELFKENLDHYPVLLPVQLDAPASLLPHMRLHNGTIWRWNRPLIGFDEDGTPHLRIEHRVLPAGPTVVDMIANAAFFYGLAEFYVRRETPPARHLPFSTAKDNFYGAARHGMSAVVTWFDKKRITIKELVLKHLLNQARQGLQLLQVEASEIDHYLTIIEQRVETGQNGAAWQRKFVGAHGRDMQLLTATYRQHQQSQRPVHTWPVS